MKDRELFQTELVDEENGGFVYVGPDSPDWSYEDTIAEFWHGNGNDAEYNARLFRQAPNMLETLKELLEEAQDNAESDPIWNYVEFIIKQIEEGEA